LRCDAGASTASGAKVTPSLQGCCVTSITCPLTKAACSLAAKSFCLLFGRRKAKVGSSRKVSDRVRVNVLDGEALDDELDDLAAHDYQPRLGCDVALACLGGPPHKVGKECG
jgi:hypothetical protein